MAKKKTATKPPRRFVSVPPITSRGTIGGTVRNKTLLRALMSRYRLLCRYESERLQLAAAIKSLGGNPDG